MNPIRTAGRLWLALALAACGPARPAPTPAAPLPTMVPLPQVETLADLFPAAPRLGAPPAAWTWRALDVGQLEVPTGELLVSDLFFAGLDAPLARQVPAGRYTVTLSLLSQPGSGFEDVAAARLQIRPQPPVAWETARFLPANGEPGADGYAVDSGMAAFSTPPSAAALTQRLDRDPTYVDAIIEQSAANELEGSWALIRPDPALAANVAGFGSGWGDGVYAAYWGLDAGGAPVCLVTEFQLISVAQLPPP
ncbi:MAG TPA: DUF4241 domain-containing protein [Herpetosiphonaceae bacterium]|nr:DUF4241 domain-containing protein [Herpetosiphonaceae bacterium]